MPAGGRHAIAEPAGEQACASKMPPGGTARKCAHLCTPGTPPAEAPRSAHPCALATCPGGSSWPAQPCAPATPPGESSWPPQPHALADAPRRVLVATTAPRPRNAGRPTALEGASAARSWWSRGETSSGVLRTSNEPRPNQKPLCHPLTPQHHNTTTMIIILESYER